VNTTSDHRVAVIGRGVIGLTSAYRLLEQGFAVDIYSRDDLALSASMAAGAYWWPHKAYPQEQVSKWARKGFLALKEEARDPKSGVKLHQHYRYCIVPDECSYCLELIDDWELLSLEKFGSRYESACRAEVPFIDVPYYMPYLAQKVEKAGAHFISKEIGRVDDLLDNYTLIVNCSGLGAAKLVEDLSVKPIRGQIIAVEKPPGLERSIRVVRKGELFTLILPRRDDCLLGGTVEAGNASLEPDRDITRQILDYCCEILPELRQSKILKERVGLRPGRSSIRLELQSFGTNKAVIHNYGHGGSGYTVAWGCADEVSGLAAKFLA